MTECTIAQTTLKMSEEDFQAWADLLNEKYGIANPIGDDD